MIAALDASNTDILVEAGREATTGFRCTPVPSSENPIMRRSAIKLLAAVLSACLLIGCGGESSPSQSAVSPPHGGHMFAFPENRGFVEIKTDRATSSRGGRAPPQARILVYFYQPDGTTVMTPAPSDVKVRVGIDDKDSVVALAPQPSDAGSFASEPGAYTKGFRGQIETRVNGEPVMVPFIFR